MTDHTTDDHTRRQPTLREQIKRKHRQIVKRSNEQYARARRIAQMEDDYAIAAKDLVNLQLEYGALLQESFGQSK
jgi:hypothetical protein